MIVVGTVIWLIIRAVAFTGLHTLVGGAAFTRPLFADLGLPPLGIVFVMIVILVVLGTFMEWIAIIFTRFQYSHQSFAMWALSSAWNPAGQQSGSASCLS